MPTTSDLQYHASIAEVKQEFIDRDPIVVAGRSHVESPEILRLLRMEASKEAAAIHFQRIENEKFGRDVAQASTRRIDALAKIAKIEHDIAKLGTEVIDLRGEKFQRIFKLWVEVIREVAQEVLPPELIDMFFNRFSQKMEGWEERASEVMQEK